VPAGAAEVYVKDRIRKCGGSIKERNTMNMIEVAEQEREIKKQEILLLNAT